MSPSQQTEIKRYNHSIDSISIVHVVTTCIIHFLFSFRLVSVLRGHSGFPSPPQRPMTSDFEWFLYQILSITLFSYLNSWERVGISLFRCWVLNKGTTWFHFFNVFDMTRSWLGIEPGISRTRSQHSSTRLLRRRCSEITIWIFKIK